ncbi:ABC transporter ATP-binding protein [Ensifer adhaerens]|uniref:ABC transporter ATP-binding protein n=1 Tax=Ensifer adhaerens TaxID=106592 RepID=UPI001CBD4F5D|nr:ABC transporter ATP-binding protein [Ensifer adhaerens]MBZ7924244.1 ABC transporter ATP-binding protein [Ensifer adhaerens]UAX96502.1 ABC transporter ATP-binding protein [Ensifer adhaerens]UAY04154.1 ABC transporter ATP-binding protein [Ensifer adhaerens]UAY12140.1 ABC transporter ATP-binding protein [Ensifer adhaerens]
MDKQAIQMQVSGLCVNYGRVPAVQTVSLTIKTGQIVTVIGANGAGKTTLLASLMGLLPSDGMVSFQGTDIRRLSVEQRMSLGISLVPEQRDLFGSMTIEDNLDLGAFRRGRADLRRSKEHVFALFPRLKERRQQIAETLSGGERQMLAMGRALMAQPRLLMLDEPSLGLAPLIVRGILQTVEKLRDEGVSILLVEQNARAALQIADYGYVMELGRIVIEGDANNLATDPRVGEVYLGGGKAAAEAVN